jgi:mannose-6-phosphate isomerase
MQPVELGPNQPKQFYRGGQAIAQWRGVAVEDEFRPEDWVASATGRFGLGVDGLSRMPDGRYLRDWLEADPEGWLGPRHVSYFGSSPALLVKLLDASQRLPVHFHPPRSFAYRHLGSRHGKTEAWVVLGTSGEEPAVYLGWSRDLEPDQVSEWVASQDTRAMLGTLNKLSVQPGDAVLVPAGTPHAIGAGVFSIELQEPTDFSIMLEFEGFDIDPAGGDVGLGRELALSCVRSQAFSRQELEHLRGPRPGAANGGGGRPYVESVFPAAANPYFRAQRTRGGAAGLEASFAVVMGLAGAGVLRGEGWQVPVRTGTTLVVPWAAGPSYVDGDVVLLRCLPPLPSDAATDDPTTTT